MPPDSKRSLLSFAVTAVLGFLFAIPLLLIAYAAAGGLLGGLAVVLVLALLQLPGYLVLRSLKLLPRKSPSDFEGDQT